MFPRVNLALARAAYARVVAAALAAGAGIGCDDGTGPGGARELSVTPEFMNLVLGATRQLSVEVRTAAGDVVSAPPLSFTSSDSTVAGVTTTGLVTARALGTATITVRSEEASANAVVRALTPAAVEIAPDAATVGVGDTVEFTAQALDYSGAPVPGASFTFESGNPSVALVIGPQGRIHAVGAGSTLLRVRLGTTADSAAISVYGPPAELRVTPDSLALVVGDNRQLAVEVRDALGTVIPDPTVAYAALDASVARVSPAGTVTAVRIGVTSVVVTSGGVGDTVPVVGTAASVSVSPSSILLQRFDTVTLTAVARDRNGDTIPGSTFTFQSTDTTVARVDAAGTVTWAGGGTAQIIAESGFRQGSADLLAIVARVPLGARPYGVAVSAADAVYVVRLDAARTTRIDPATWQPGPHIVVGSVPTDVTFNGAGTRAYVTNQSSQSVSVLESATDTELERIPLPADPFVVAVPAGDTLLYVSANNNRVYGIDLATRAIVDSIPMGSFVGLATGLAARDSLLYASLFFDGAVIEYNLRTRARGRTFVTGGRPQGIALSADGTTLFVADENGALQFWNLLTGSRTGVLALPPGGAFDAAPQPGTGLVFVTGLFGGAVYIVDPVTRTIQDTLPVGGVPRRVAFTAGGDAVVTNEANWVDVLR